MNYELILKHMKEEDARLRDVLVKYKLAVRDLKEANNFWFCSCCYLTVLFLMAVGILVAK